MAITWDLNNYAMSTVVGGTAMYLLKNALQAAGWTIIGSGDTVNYSAVADVIGSPAEFILNGSWIVLRSPRAPNRQVLLGHKGGTSDTDWCVAYSKGAGFSGGAPDKSTYPTAADSGTVWGTLPGTLSTMFAAWGSYIHIMVSDATDTFYCVVVGKMGAGASPSYSGWGVTHGGLFLDELTNTAPGDPDPVVIGSMYANGEFFSSSLLYYDGSVGRKSWIKGAPDTFQNLGLCSWGFDAGYTGMPWNSSGRGIGINAFDGKVAEMPGLWVRDAALAAPYGYKGFSSIFKTVSAPITVPSTIDISPGTRNRIILGVEFRTSMPWDGSTPLIV